MISWDEPCTNPEGLWAQFAREVGQEVIDRCYRVKTGFPAPKEEVWEFWQNRERGRVLVGWGSLSPVPMVDSMVLYRGGIFPQYQREGLIDEISLAMANTAFADRKVQWVQTNILFSNPEQIARRLRKAAEGHWWGYPVGMSLVPEPGHLTFVLPRDRWSRL